MNLLVVSLPLPGSPVEFVAVFFGPIVKSFPGWAHQIVVPNAVTDLAHEGSLCQRCQEHLGSLRLTGLTLAVRFDRVIDQKVGRFGPVFIALVDR